MTAHFDFHGRHAVVTGGAQGIGLEIARSFLAAGGQVSIWDFSAAALTEAKQQLAPWQGQLHTDLVDVGDFAACEAAAARLPWPVHVLVNNAGITRDKTVGKLSPDDFEAVVRTNLTGAFHAVKSLLDRFTAADSAKRIVNMASVVALYGNFGQTNYAAAKAGLIGMTKTLARELGRKGFTVNAIAPGFIETTMTAAVPAESLRDIAARVPIGRLGKPADIAAACLFLASDAASYINGAVISVDGGLVL